MEYFINQKGKPDGVFNSSFSEYEVREYTYRRRGRCGRMRESRELSEFCNIPYFENLLV